MPGTGPRPAIKCDSGVLTWQGMTTTPMNMREAKLNPDKPWDFYCCPVGGEISEGGCSEPATFEAVPVPEVAFDVGLIVGIMAIAILYSLRAKW